MYNIHNENMNKGKMDFTKQFIGGKELSPAEKIQLASFADANLTKEQIHEWLEKDMRGVYVLLTEVLASPECLLALSEAYYKRYQQLKEKLANAPELNLK